MDTIQRLRLLLTYIKERLPMDPAQREQAAIVQGHTLIVLDGSLREPIEDNPVGLVRSFLEALKVELIEPPRMYDIIEPNYEGWSFGASITQGIITGIYLEETRGYVHSKSGPQGLETHKHTVEHTATLHITINYLGAVNLERVTRCYLDIFPVTEHLLRAFTRDVAALKAKSLRKQPKRPGSRDGAEASKPIQE